MDAFISMCIAMWIQSLVCGWGMCIAMWLMFYQLSYGCEYPISIGLGYTQCHFLCTPISVLLGGTPITVFLGIDQLLYCDVHCVSGDTSIIAFQGMHLLLCFRCYLYYSVSWATSISVSGMHLLLCFWGYIY